MVLRTAMAKEEAKKEPQAFIDYTGDSSAVPADDYTPTNFYDYWRKALARHHRTAALPITIKEAVLWKRLIEQYEPPDLIAMIDKWMDGTQCLEPSNFVHFYSRAEVIHQMLRRDYEWD